MGKIVHPHGTPVARRKNRVIKVNKRTLAAFYNKMMMRRIVEALKRDPEANLVAIIDKAYVEKREQQIAYTQTARLGSSQPSLIPPPPSPPDDCFLTQTQ